MQEASKSGEAHYPPGVRPFRSPVEIGELDEAWSEAAGSDVDVGVRVPRGATLREAMRLVHFELTTRMKELMVIGLKNRFQQHKAQMTRK